MGRDAQLATVLRVAGAEGKEGDKQFRSFLKKFAEESK